MKYIKKLGACSFKLAAIGINPDGKNINRSRGSTAPDHLREMVMSGDADLGVAFDGDGDRILVIDAKGNLLDGDHLMYIISKYFKALSQWDSDQVVVGTVMSNIGLEKALAREGIGFVRTGVGDRNVFFSMKEHKSSIGGEQSGHIILKHFQKTGDGILTAIFLLKALSYFKINAEDLFQELDLNPQVTKNIPVSKKRNLQDWDQLNEMLLNFNQKYGDEARILIRYSGTEPLVRIMVESSDMSIINDNLAKFQDLFNSNSGG